VCTRIEDDHCGELIVKHLFDGDACSAAVQLFAPSIDKGDVTVVIIDGVSVGVVSANVDHDWNFPVCGSIF